MSKEGINDTEDEINEGEEEEDDEQEKEEEDVEQEEEEHDETEDNFSKSILITSPPKYKEKPVQKPFPCLECTETFINKQFLRAHTR